MKNGSLTLPEISNQAEALSAAHKQLSVQEDWVTKYMASTEFDEIVFIGSGSSFYQAQIMATTYRLWMGRPASALPSSDIFLFRDQSVARNQKVLLVGVSRSGESSEVILALDSVKDLNDWTTCGITCYESSRLGIMTPCLVSPLGKEKSTVMTKSFSSMTFMMQAAIALAAHGNRSAEMESTLELQGEIVKRSQPFAENIVNENQFGNYIFLGMGSYFGLAQEACLKLKEMAYVWTECYGTLEFRHGPKSIVDSSSFICLLVSEQARAYELKVAEEMKEYGAYVLLLTTKKGEDTAFADAVFELGADKVSDEARAALYLPLLQYFGFYTAMSRGVDPDQPRNLTQVVTI